MDQEKVTSLHVKHPQKKPDLCIGSSYDFSFDGSDQVRIGGPEVLVHLKSQTPKSEASKIKFKHHHSNADDFSHYFLKERNREEFKVQSLVKNGLNVEERTEENGIFNSGEVEPTPNLSESHSLEGRGFLRSQSNSHLDQVLESILEEQEIEG